jgi:uncharacterized damage-inducible protein DinB
VSENRILTELMRHTSWANDEMVGACLGLTPEQLGRESIGTYGRLDHTLVHLARSQGGYTRRLSDWEPGPEHRLEYEEPFPGVDRIAAHLRFTGEKLLGVAAGISADRIVEVEGDQGPELLPAWVVLLQAAQHATEHRQQLATALTGLGIEPPEPDLWAYWETIRPRSG